LWMLVKCLRSGLELSLQIEMNPYREVLVVRLHGELDHHTAEGVRQQIDQELQKDHYSHIILNFAELSFMDSSGLGVILGRYKRINEKGGTLAVCSLHPSVRKLFELSGMFKIITAYQREEDALGVHG